MHPTMTSRCARCEIAEKQLSMKALRMNAQEVVSLKAMRAAASFMVIANKVSINATRSPQLSKLLC